jgi:hypothetical protein
MSRLHRLGWPTITRPGIQLHTEEQGWISPNSLEERLGWREPTILQDAVAGRGRGLNDRTEVTGGLEATLCTLLLGMTDLYLGWSSFSGNTLS